MKLSVFVVTYNQERYIAQCLDSILMQKVDFDYEIVIGEDHGTDSTRAICEKYAVKHPQIRLLSLTENLGIAGNWERVLSECKGEHIAMCEGDDYWTDPTKLQTQIDILDSDKNLYGCFHKANYISDKGDIISEIQEGDSNKKFYFKELIDRWIVPTASLVFRNDKFIINGIQKLAKYSGVSTDRLLVALIAYKGNLLYLNKNMSIWREANNSIHKTMNNINIYKGNITLYKSLKTYIPEESEQLSHQVMKWHGLLALEYYEQSKYMKYVVELLNTMIHIRSFVDLKTWAKNYLFRMQI